MTNDFYDGFEVIDTYTDEEAVEDGVLVPVRYGEIGFVTSNVLADFEKNPEEVRSQIIDLFLKDAEKTFAAQRKTKDDWFYEITVWKERYFFALNGKGSFTLMKPEDY